MFTTCAQHNVTKGHLLMCRHFSPVFSNRESSCYYTQKQGPWAALRRWKRAYLHNFTHENSWNSRTRHRNTVDMETTEMTQPASFWAHIDDSVKPAPSLPALFLSTIIKKLPPQPASFYTTRWNSDFSTQKDVKRSCFWGIVCMESWRNSNFVGRDFMNHQENHRGKHSDFHRENLRFL